MAQHGGTDASHGGSSSPRATEASLATAAPRTTEAALVPAGAPRITEAGPPPDIMLRLGCARMVLQRSKGKPIHELTSQTQAAAVVDVMKQLSKEVLAMGPDSRARVVALVAAGAWQPDDMTNIMKCLVPQKAARAPMQKFTPNILHYFTAAEWAGMRGAKIGTAMDFLITRLLQLGGRCLSEPCKAWCASLLLLLNGMSQCTNDTRNQVLQFFKQEYSRRGRKDPELQVLPMPTELKAEQPALYQAVFGMHDPVPSAIEMSTLKLHNVFCRASRSKSTNQLCKIERASRAW